MIFTAARCLPLFLLVGVAFVPIKVLEVEAQKSGRTLLLKSSPIGLQLELSYIHSVEKVPVLGRFQIVEPGRLKPQETTFASFGPGLPSQEDGKTAEGWFLKKETHTPLLEELSILVSPETRQVLKIDRLKIELHKLEHGEKVRVRVRRHALAEVIWHHAKP